MQFLTILRPVFTSKWILNNDPGSVVCCYFFQNCVSVPATTFLKTRQINHWEQIHLDLFIRENPGIGDNVTIVHYVVFTGYFDIYHKLGVITRTRRIQLIRKLYRSVSIILVTSGSLLDRLYVLLQSVNITWWMLELSGIFVTKVSNIE